MKTLPAAAVSQQPCVESVWSRWAYELRMLAVIILADWMLSIAPKRRDGLLFVIGMHNVMKIISKIGETTK